MATEGTSASAVAPPAQFDGQAAAATAGAPAAAPTETPQLTPAQLKAKAKAEKAARRAKVKEDKEAVAAAVQSQAADAKGGKGKGKDGAQTSGSLGLGKTGLAHRPSMSGRRPSILVVEKDIRSSIPECFSHLPMAKRIPLSQVHKDVHPAVLSIGQQMSTFAIKDSITRLEATLKAFRKVGSLSATI
jgi:translation initiation factor eIF-2B subunit delta